MTWNKSELEKKLDADGWRLSQNCTSQDTVEVLREQYLKKGFDDVRIEDAYRSDGVTKITHMRGIYVKGESHSVRALRERKGIPDSELLGVNTP